MPAYNYASSDRQVVNGHYTLTQKSGIITGAPAAGSFLASFRWAPANPLIYCVLLRVKVSIVQISALAATLLDLSGTIARNWTADFSGNNTQADMSKITSTGAVRTNLMTSSQMGSKGPQICTTTGMTGQTAVLDTDFTHATPLNNSATAGNSASATLYDRALEGQHPILFSGNNPSGYIIRNIAILPANNMALYVTWEWAETYNATV